MPVILDTSPISYATPDDLLARYDSRTIGDLASDDNRRLTREEIIASPIVRSILQDASGIVESYCIAGGRYTHEDLLSLTGNAKNLLIRLVCDIAYLLLKDRRGYVNDQPNNEIITRTSTALTKLRNGELLFGYSKNIEASVSRTSTKPAAIIRFFNPTATDLAVRLFGLRSPFRR